MTKKVTFFDIPLDQFTSKSLEMMLEEALDGISQTLIATPNPEMLMAARSNDEMLQTLYRMHNRIPDGFGLSLMSKLTGQGKLRRFPGTDVLVDIARLGSTRNMHMMIVGGLTESCEKTKQILESAFPGLTVSYKSDIKIDYDGDWKQPDDLVSSIISAKPDIIAVALGSSNYHKQEKWIIDFVPGILSAKLAIGVGGAIDMIAGTTKRAPNWMRMIGIEWLWRLAIQPSRFKRIFTAVVLFPIAVIQDTITPQN